MPQQSEDPELEFTNRVVTAEWFAQQTQVIAELGGKAEVLDEEIANLQVHLRRKERELQNVRLSILARCYGKITKSADKVVQEAFIRSMAVELKETDTLTKLDLELEDIRQEIEIREPRRDQYYTRLKILKDSQESARQYLDHEKLQTRINLMNSGKNV